MKYILFDLDGTITDPKEGITKSVQYALEKCGIIVNNLDELTTFIGPPLNESFAKYFNLNDEEIKKAIVYYREYYTDKGIFENIVYPGIEHLLEELQRAGKEVILATSKPLPYAKKILDYFNLRKYFSFIGGSELDGRRTAKNEVIEYIIKENNITDLKDVIMIGDREHDAIGAKKVGIAVIGILYGYGSKEELEKANCDYLFANIDQLKKFLMQ